MFLRDHPSSTSSFSAPVLVFLFGCLLTLLGMGYHSQLREEFLQQRFSVISDRLASRLQERILGYEKGLRGTRSAFLALGLDRMTLERFQVVSRSRDPDIEFPGVRGFGMIRRVPAGGEQAFLTEMQRLGRPDLQIRELEPNPGERFVISYIEPQARNEQAVGLDIGSEANRRAAMLEAMRNGKATLTHPITLVQASGKVSQGFLLLLPMYPDHVVPAQETAREASSLGAVYAPLLIDEVLADFDLSGEGVALRLLDQAADGQYTGFFESSSSEPLADELGAVRDLNIFGRSWRAEFHALPAFAASLGSSSKDLIIGAGLMVSLLLALLAHRLQRDRIHQLQLRNSEQRLSLFIEHAPAALAMFDRNMCYIAVSRRWLGDYGLDDLNLIGRCHYDLFPEIGADWKAIHRRALAGEVVRAERDAFLRADGKVQWLRWEVRPWFDAMGMVGGLLVFSEDVTSLKQVEDEIRLLNATLEAQVRERTTELDAARRSLRAVLDAVPSMIGYWDRHLINRVANHAYAKWFGIDPQTMPGRHIHDLLGDQLYELNRAYIDGVLAGQPQVFERAIPRPDGTGMRHSLAYYLPDIVDGEVCGFHVIVHDVTELTESRERLAATLRENEMLLQSIDKQLIYSVTDPAGVILSVNDRFCEISGYSREELIGQTHHLLESGVHEAGLWQGMWQELSAGRAWRGDICNRRRDGSLFWVDTVIAPLTGPDGSIERIVALRYDITMNKQALQVLEEAKAAAERANQAKSAFVANTSHEIRTPLNAIIGMAYLLEKSELDGDQRQQLHAIQLASRTLLELINDLLDLAKMEAGELHFEQRAFDLVESLQAVSQIFQAQAHTKGLSLDFEPLPANLPAQVLGDELRLRQVLNNLIGNALKFTATGGVTVRVLRQASSAEDARLHLRFEVQDTGEGIAADLIGNLFRPFSQVDTSSTRRHGGTGLGLSIVRQMIEGMGGRVGLESEPGAGSLFWFELAFESAVTAPAGGAGNAGSASAAASELDLDDPACRWLPGVRVLVVDDGTLNLDVCRRLLELQGATVSLCLDGQKAVDILRRSPDYFDLVLMDVQMPVMDGFTATRLIRRDPSLSHLPVIALTAGVSSEQVAQALDAGMDEVLAKPLEPRQLIGSIRACVERQWGCRLPVERVLPAAGAAAGAHSELPEIAGLDVRQAIRRLQCDIPVYRDMLQRFQDAHAGLPDEVRALLRVGRLEQAAALLHRMRGLAATLGAVQLAAAAAVLEEALHVGAEPDEQMIAALRGSHAELFVGLQAFLRDAGEPRPAAQPAGVTLDVARLEQQLALLEQQLSERLLSAAHLNEEITAALRGTALEAGYESVTRAVSRLRYAEAVQALQQFRDAIRQMDSSA